MVAATLNTETSSTANILPSWLTSGPPLWRSGGVSSSSSSSPLSPLAGSFLACFGTGLPAVMEIWRGKTPLLATLHVLITLEDSPLHSSTPLKPRQLLGMVDERSPLSAQVLWPFSSSSPSLEQLSTASCVESSCPKSLCLKRGLRPSHLVTWLSSAPKKVLSAYQSEWPTCARLWW